MKLRMILVIGLFIAVCSAATILIVVKFREDKALGQKQFLLWCNSSNTDSFSWTGKSFSYSVSRIKLKPTVDEKIYIVEYPKEYAPHGGYFVYPSGKLVYGCDAVWKEIRKMHSIQVPRQIEE